MAECKYSTYSELAAAFKAGELDGWKLILDNDNCSLSYRGPTPEELGGDEDAIEEWEDRMYDEGLALFHGDGEADLEKVVDALGIPCEMA